MESNIEQRVLNNRKACDMPTCTLHIEVEELKLAFPDGVHNHREVHLAWMKAKQAEADFYTSMKKEIMTKGIGGLFMLLIIIIGLAFTGLLSKLGLPH